jgi:nucleoside-diphosphate-sugar epimerase
MRFIVTGARGYIGSRLVQELSARGHDVAAIGRGDRIDELSGKWDAMYNLAWTGKGGKLRADCAVQMENVKAALDYRRAALRLGCARFIAAGTIGEKMLSLDECARIKSENFVYAATKNYLHALLNALGGDGCQTVWATIGNVYGASGSGGNIVEWALRTVLDGRPAEFGPAEEPYDFVHIDDAVRALALLGTCESAPDAVYVGSGRPRPLKEFLLEIGRVAGRPELIGIGRRADDGTRYRAEWFDISELSRATGFSPRKDFAEGVAEAAAALKDGDSGR